MIQHRGFMTPWQPTPPGYGTKIMSRR